MFDTECTDRDTDAACCVNTGCGNLFDPASEGFNGECDWCAALAADHFAGAHLGFEVDCSFCFSESGTRADWTLAAP